ncbi:hypothetical protein ABCR94_16875 [Streptomyces sp. 21So2-11]|uniref:hypothetical protein n=1 Tax=Streptomyces sp. 21So2-11 TaxID=3144408 RepID=UPI00321C0E26
MGVPRGVPDVNLSEPFTAAANDDDVIPASASGSQPADPGAWSWPAPSSELPVWIGQVRSGTYEALVNGRIRSGASERDTDYNKGKATTNVTVHNSVALPGMTQKTNIGVEATEVS